MEKLFPNVGLPLAGSSPIFSAFTDCPPCSSMSSTTYIIGHKNPDADAICSAMAYAAYKDAIGEKGFVAARCGNSNARIDAILKRFKLPLPLFVGDVTPRVADIMKRNIRKIGPDATCYEALGMIDQYDVRALPVVSPENRILGMVSIFNLGEFFIPKPREPKKMRHVHTCVTQIIEALNAQVLNSVEPDRTEELYVRVGAMDIRSFGKFTVTEKTSPEQSIIVVGDRYDIQQKAIQMKSRLLVITGSLEVDPEVVDLAKERGVSLIISPYDSATTSWIIRTATRVAPMVETQVPTFGLEEKLVQVKRRVANTYAPIYCVTDDEGKLLGLFSKTDLLKPVQTRLVLVDHNELGQAVNGASEVQIMEIIDHHRLGNPPTSQPILFRNDIIGSTCSIIADMYRSSSIKPPPSIAGIMMSGLISDTLNLQSPTTTSKDADLLAWLEDVAGVKAGEIADLVFKSGSVVLGSSPADIITTDCKQYHQGDFKYSVSQVEELGFNHFWQKSTDLLQALNDYRKSEGLDFSCLLVTDINTQNSLLLVCGDEDAIEKISYSPVEKGQIYDLPGIVSRKKQLIPYLTQLIDALGISAGGQ